MKNGSDSIFKNEFLQCKNQSVSWVGNCGAQQCTNITLAKCKDWCADQGDGWHCKFKSYEPWLGGYTYHEHFIPTLCNGGKTVHHFSWPVQACTCTSYLNQYGIRHFECRDCYDPCGNFTPASIAANPPKFLNEHNDSFICNFLNGDTVGCKRLN